MSDLKTGGYTVGRVAELSGVTIRTLHHYDEVGLLSPGERSAAGYRIYEERDLERLQRILFDGIRGVAAEHRGIGAGYLRNALAHLLQGRAGADEAVGGGPVSVDFVYQVGALLLYLRFQLLNLLEGKQVFERQRDLGY